MLPIEDVEDQLDELPNEEENWSGKSEILTACLCSLSIPVYVISVMELEAEYCASSVVRNKLISSGMSEIESAWWDELEIVPSSCSRYMKLNFSGEAVLM